MASIASLLHAWAAVDVSSHLLDALVLVSRSLLAIAGLLLLLLARVLAIAGWLVSLLFFLGFLRCLPGVDNAGGGLSLSDDAAADQRGCYSHTIDIVRVCDEA
jgi:hypothetical protein